MRAATSLVLAGLAVLAAGCVAPPPPPNAGNAPAHQIAVTANPLATAAAIDMLRQGGSAVDAAIAAEAVLGLLEPQASGLLGGTDLLVYAPSTGEVRNFDGMATAPAAASS